MNYGDLKKSVDPTEQEGKTSPGAYVLDELSLGKILDDGQSGPEFHEVVDLTSRFSTISISQSLADSFMTMTIGISDATQILERLGSKGCLLYTSPSPRDRTRSRMPSSA